MGVSDLEFGVNGPRGLGYFRVPAVMLVDISGNNRVPGTILTNIRKYAKHSLREIKNPLLKSTNILGD